MTVDRGPCRCAYTLIMNGRTKSAKSKTKRQDVESGIDAQDDGVVIEVEEDVKFSRETKVMKVLLIFFMRLILVRGFFSS